VSAPAGVATAPRDGVVVRRTRVSEVRRVRFDGRDAYAKVYRYAWPLIPILGWLKGNPPALDARREAANLGRAAALGVPVPRVLAVEAPGRLFRRESVVVLEAAPGEPLDRALGGLEARARRDVAARLGAIVRRLHEAAVFHRDLYLCHILVDGAAGERLTLLDLARAEPRRLFRRRFRVKDLAALELSAREAGAGRAERVAFLKAYLGEGRGSSPSASPSASARASARAARRALLRAVVEKAGRMAAHGRKG